MPIYCVGYSHVESPEHTLLFYEKPLTKEQLAGFVHQATRSALERLLALPKEDHVRQRAFMTDEGTNFERMYPHVIEELCSMGFEKVEPRCAYYCFGNESIVTEDCWGRIGNRMGTAKDIRDAIPDRLKKRVLEAAGENDADLEAMAKSYLRNKGGRRSSSSKGKF